MTDQTTIPDEPQANELQAGVDAVQREIAAFDRIQAGIAELHKKHPADLVLDVATPAGMKEAIKARAAWRDPRVQVEKVREAAKRPVLDMGRRIDKFAKVLEEQLRVGELHYNGMIKAENDRIEAEKKAKAEAEAARVQAIRDRIALWFTSQPQRMFGQPAKGLQAAIDAMEARPTDAESFSELVDEATQAKEDAIEEVRALHRRAVTQEEEAERQRKLAEENERQAQLLADERAEFERQQAAAKKDADAREAAAKAERDAQEERIAEQRRLAAEEAERVRAEQKALDDAKRTEADRLAEEQRQQAEQRAAAERKRLDDEAAEQRRLADEQAAAARRAAEEKTAAEEAKRAKAARKLAAAQKAGPRTLAALRELLAQVEQADTSEGGDIKAYEAAKKEARAAIAEGEAA